MSSGRATIKRPEWPTVDYLRTLLLRYSAFGLIAGGVAFACIATVRHPGGVALFLAGGAAVTLAGQSQAVVQGLFGEAQRFKGFRDKKILRERAQYFAVEMLVCLFLIEAIRSASDVFPKILAIVDSILGPRR
jgi:hypothetical protein